MLAAAADINGDGLPDFIIACDMCSPGGLCSAGSVYVFYGKGYNWPTSPYNVGAL